MKTNEYIGTSETSLSDAIKNALKKAGDYSRFEIIESQSSQSCPEKYHYQVLLRIL